MSDHKLVLHPANPEASLPPEGDFRARLSSIGLLGLPFDHFGATHYRQGSRFKLLLPFSSPHEVVVLAPQTAGLEKRTAVDSTSLVSIELCGTADIQFLGAANVENPSCVACGYVLNDWTAVVSAWYDAPDNYQWTCPRCHRVARPWALNWAYTNGFGRFSIAFWHVNHGEAAPSTELLCALHEFSDTPWTYFYYHL